MSCDEPSTITKAEFESLARFRRILREFLRFSEVAARREGIAPQQHQLLLAIKGMPNRESATISEIASALQLAHHAAVQLVDRAAALDLVVRVRDQRDKRQVFVRVTEKGEALLCGLTDIHRAELRRVREELIASLQNVPEPVSGL